MDRSSEDAVGNDADRVEFRYRDSTEVRSHFCAGYLVDGVASQRPDANPDHHSVQGAACSRGRLRADGAVRPARCCPSALVAQCFDAGSGECEGVHVTFVAGLDAGNFHVQAESKLVVREPEIWRSPR